MGKGCSQDFFQFYWTLSPRCTIVQGSWRPRGGGRCAGGLGQGQIKDVGKLTLQ